MLQSGHKTLVTHIRICSFTFSFMLFFITENFTLCLPYSKKMKMFYPNKVKYQPEPGNGFTSMPVSCSVCSRCSAAFDTSRALLSGGHILGTAQHQPQRRPCSAPYVRWCCSLRRSGVSSKSENVPGALRWFLALCPLKDSKSYET